MSTATLLHWIVLAGVAVGAITGALDAGRKGMDIVGACAVGLATAAGGGTVRDLLLGRPVFWVIDQTYLLTALGAAIATFFLIRAVRLPAHLFLVPDALGLALFTVSGTQVALAAGTPSLVACLMGVITGVVGGVLRDILCAEIPLIFLPGQLYAVAAAAGAIALVLAERYGLPPSVAAICGFVVAAALRLAAMAFRLKAPVFDPQE